MFSCVFLSDGALFDVLMGYSSMYPNRPTSKYNADLLMYLFRYGGNGGPIQCLNFDY